MTSPIDHYLAEQGRLQTPVGRFAAADPQGPAGFATLIPLSAPSPGHQYAFEVDLDACTGCKACVAACHSLNGLDEDETWRDIGLLTGRSGDERLVQTVTTACHHCTEPGCLDGCPVLAYEKDPVTGIVRHLDDQCIGCSYCILKCPYDVPKYNRARGIVRKCDMCSDRLAHGEPPACVQACPTHAIRITMVATEAVGRSEDFLPCAPDPEHTGPATRYLSSREGIVWKEEAGAGELAPEPSHWPLAVMTTLVAMGTGCTALAGFGPHVASSPRLWLAGGLAGTVGLLTSLLHLGQPLRAWRIFLGLRRSWMSREALLLSLWAPAALAIGLLERRHVTVPPAVQALVAAVGVAGFFASAMIYVDTPRPAWALWQTGTRFWAGALALTAAFTAAAAPRAKVGALLVCWLALATKGAAEASLVRWAAKSRDRWVRRTARLLRGPLLPLGVARAAMGLAGAVLLAAWPQPIRLAGLALLLAGELAERLLFFRGAAAPRMPGVGRS